MSIRKVLILMIKEKRQKIQLIPELKKKLDWAIKYTSSKVNIKKGTLIKLEPTNIAYIEHHKIIINNDTFLFYNGSDSFFINDYNIKYKLSDLDKYLKLASKNL